jgi:CHAT domain-containing protein
VKRITSPRVVHIATHGFFIDEQQSLETQMLDIDNYQNPLLKSGLLFVGAEELLSENNIYQFNRADGILTAFEAMNLKLDHTELVVLSACETGLGEVHAGEGVFGLQRSFIVAGAQNIIMTLFKVNDQVTQELMQDFYSAWIETGDKRSAFQKAKQNIRNKYESPIFWGSFVMVGLD